MTLDVAAQRLWVEHAQHKASAQDIDERLNLAVSIIGPKKPLCEIDDEVIAIAIQKRRGRLVRGKKVPSNATVNRDMIDTTMRPLLRRARRIWKVPGVQDIDWKALRLEEPEPHPRDFNSKDLGKLHGALAVHWREFAHFEGRYALRVGEMFFLPSAVDVERRELTIIRTVRKNKRAITIPLLDDDVAMLAARISQAEAAKINTVWFRRKRSGRLVALTYRGAIRAFMQAMTDSGLRASHGARGTHDLRHHGGMQALRASNNLRTTQKLLGHASIKSTMVYAHALDADVRAALEAVSRSAPEPAQEVAEEAQEKQRDAG